MCLGSVGLGCGFFGGLDDSLDVGHNGGHDVGLDGDLDVSLSVSHNGGLNGLCWP